MEKYKKKSGSIINKFNILFVDLQIVMTILTIIVFILFLFNSGLKMYLQLSLGVTLLVMAYNNQRIYKRKGATIMYIIVGIALLVLDLLMLLGIGV